MDNNYNYLNDMNSDYLNDMENKDETLTKREVIYLMARSFSNNAFSSEKAYLELIDNVKNAQTKHDPNHEQIYEDSLEKAKELINDFCVDEYGEGADFTDLHDVGIAYTTYTDDEKEFQVTADLIDCKITYEYDGETVKTEQYKDIDDMVKNGLTGLDFDELVSLPDNISDKVYIQEAADRFKKDTDSLINTVHDFYDKVYEGEKSISKEDVAAALTDPAKASKLATQLQADIEGVGVDTAYFGFSSDTALGAAKALEDIAKGLESKNKVFIVELDDSGNYERFALTESDFKLEYPDTDIDRMRDGDTDTLKPFTHIWAKEVTIGDDDWKAHFTDMEQGLPDSDIENGNLAYVNYFKCSSALEESVRETAFHLEFSAITIEDSSFDRDGGGASVYTAVLADNYYDQEVSDRFQFELMRRSGLELDLLDDGVEVKNFENFKELRKPEELGLKIELLYAEYGDQEETVSARALYGSQSTRSEELVLTPREKESLDRFYDSDITPDKEKVQQEYNKEID